MTQLFEGSDPNACADFLGADTYKKRIRAAAKFCAERHKIYVLKSRGAPKPWTQDPVLQSGRFCNIYRELDKVTEWIMNKWINPQVANENVMCLAVVGRLINHPETLQMMIDEGFDFTRKPNTERLFKLFEQIRETKGRQLVTGAYIVNTIFPKDAPKVNGTKADYIANFFVPTVWGMRKQLREGLETGSFRETINAFKQIHGIGAFIANQAAVDLSYTKLLSGAEDIDTTWNPGPGTTKGIRWITDDWTLSNGQDKMEASLSKYLADLNEELTNAKMFSPNNEDMRTHIVPVSGPNASNSLCELSKIVWMYSGKRDRMKNTYPGLR